MKSNYMITTVLGTVGLAVGLLSAPSAAQARSNVFWSVGVGSPGVAVGVSNGFPGYAAPAPVYVQPRPVYVQPQPYYVQPRPVYTAPPVYYGAPLVVGAPPFVVRPQAVYPIGWGPRAHWRHPHYYRQGPRWRY